MVQSRSSIPKTEFALLIGLGRQGSCLLHSRQAVKIVQIISARHTSGEIIEEMEALLQGSLFHPSLTQHHVLTFRYCHLLDSSFVHSFSTGIRNSTYPDPEFSPHGSGTGDQQTITTGDQQDQQESPRVPDIAEIHSRPPPSYFLHSIGFSEQKLLMLLLVIGVYLDTSWCSCWNIPTL